MAPLKKIMKKEITLLSTTLLNRFEGSCDTFGEGKKNPIVINDIRSICPKNE